MQRFLYTTILFKLKPITIYMNHRLLYIWPKTIGKYKTVGLPTENKAVSTKKGNHPVKRQIHLCALFGHHFADTLKLMHV